MTILVHLVSYTFCIGVRERVRGCSMQRENWINTKERCDTAVTDKSLNCLWTFRGQRHSLTKRHQARLSLAEDYGRIEPYTVYVAAWSRKRRWQTSTVCVRMCVRETVYAWSLTEADSPTHILGGGGVCWWRLLTHSHTQNTLACSCRNAVHISEQTGLKSSCSSSSGDRITSVYSISIWVIGLFQFINDLWNYCKL